jgi:hypothetical protein
MDELLASTEISVDEQKKNTRRRRAGGLRMRQGTASRRRNHGEWEASRTEKMQGTAAALDRPLPRSRAGRRAERFGDALAAAVAQLIGADTVACKAATPLPRLGLAGAGRPVLEYRQAREESEEINSIKI